VVAHSSVVRRHVEPVSIEIVPSSHPEAAELCVVAQDRPGLLAKIAAALSASNLDVLAAQVYSRRSPTSVTAVDLFWVQGRFEGAQAIPRALPVVRKALTELLDGGLSPQEILRRKTWPKRSGPEVKTRVAIDHRASSNQSVIEVSTLDRPGLLFSIANAFFELGLSIRVAKINTEGTRIADVFYVTEADGSKVRPGPRSLEIEQRLLSVLQPPTV
jgi:[protein-PII] uridylyltransferase